MAVSKPRGRLRSIISLALLSSCLDLHASDVSRADVVATADGCVTTTLASCAVDHQAKLAAGDCTLSTGEYADYYDFTGVAGQVVEITLRPTSSTYRAPAVGLIPPPGDGSKPPFVWGGPAATIWYKLTSSGRWRVAVSTTNVLSSGTYVLHIKCHREFDIERQCIEQDLLCNQFALWNLNAESCRYSDADEPYASWLIFAEPGDSITVQMNSTAFTPNLDIWDGEKYVAQGIRDSSTVTTVRFFPTTRGYFEVIASAGEGLRGGDFAIASTCTTSGCLSPWFLTPIENQRVSPGARATIPLNLSMLGPFTAVLREDLSEAATSKTNTIVTPPVNGTHRYVVDVSNECGNVSSNVFTITSAPPRRRSAGH